MFSSSIKDREASIPGNATGFDYMRLALAVFIFLWHSYLVAYGRFEQLQLWDTIFGDLVRLVLPMFFALSGYLVAGSLERTKTLFQFAGNRVVRIFPALTMEVLLSAFVLGPLVTSLPLWQYFSDWMFFRYLFNIFGLISYFLPGVFDTNPGPWTNLSLWTVPFELECYIALIGLAWLGLVKRSKRFILVLLLVQIALPLLEAIYPDMTKTTTVSGRSLVMSFLWGVAIYMYRDKIPYSWSLCAAMAGLMTACSIAGANYYIYCAPAAYVTVMLGLTTPKHVKYVFSGDYSYGMYLYAMPFQQLAAWAFPGARTWLENVLISFPMICLFAFFSWHLVEKPILSRRKSIIGVFEPRWDALIAFLAKPPKSGPDDPPPQGGAA